LASAEEKKKTYEKEPLKDTDNVIEDNFDGSELRKEDLFSKGLHLIIKYHWMYIFIEDIHSCRSK